MTSEEAIRRIWEFHKMGQRLEACDLIWALGSHDLRVADRVAELWHAGLAPLIVMSGGYGNFTEGVFKKPEAELFAERAMELGVPEEAILIESRSTNTGENVQFTRMLLDHHSIEVRKAIAVQKPYMERRTYATISKQWEEVEVMVTSPQLDLDEYCQEVISRDDLTHIMVGDLQRIMVYPEQGFMVRQDIPGDVFEAWTLLVAMGFRNHLLPEVT